MITSTERTGTRYASRTRLFFATNRDGQYEIYVRSDGVNTRLTNDSRFDSFWPKLSPDKKKILFYRTAKGVHDGNYDGAELWLMNADGTGQTKIRPKQTNSWTMQGHVEWSPDGAWLIMMGGIAGGIQAFITNPSGLNPSQITTGTPILDPTFTSDGKILLVRGNVVTELRDGLYISLYSGPGNHYDPYCSPDGTKIAWLVNDDPLNPLLWSVWIMERNGLNPRRLTNQSVLSSKPHWGPDGRIYFHRLDYAAGKPWEIWSMLSDGTDLQPVVTGFGDSEYPDVR